MRRAHARALCAVLARLGQQRRDRVVPPVQQQQHWWRLASARAKVEQLALLHARQVVQAGRQALAGLATVLVAQCEATAQREHERGQALSQPAHRVCSVAIVPGKGLQHYVGTRDGHYEVVPLQCHKVAKVLLGRRQAGGWAGGGRDCQGVSQSTSQGRRASQGRAGRRRRPGCTCTHCTISLTSISARSCSRMSSRRLEKTDDQEQTQRVV